MTFNELGVIAEITSFFYKVTPHFSQRQVGTIWDKDGINRDI